MFDANVWVVGRSKAVEVSLTDNGRCPHGGERLFKIQLCFRDHPAHLFDIEGVRALDNALDNAAFIATRLECDLNDLAVLRKLT